MVTSRISPEFIQERVRLHLLVIPSRYYTTVFFFWGRFWRPLAMDGHAEQAGVGAACSHRRNGGRGDVGGRYGGRSARPPTGEATTGNSTWRGRRSSCMWTIRPIRHWRKSTRTPGSATGSQRGWRSEDWRSSRKGERVWWADESRRRRSTAAARRKQSRRWVKESSGLQDGLSARAIWSSPIETGLIVGVARGGLRRPDLAGNAIGWQGYARAPGASALDVYGVLENSDPILPRGAGTRACRVPTHRDACFTRTRIPQGCTKIGHVELSERMRADWNKRAREDAHYYVAFGRRDQDDSEFLATAADAIRDLEGELKRLPKGVPASSRRALEIGCGPGRLMRFMSRHFGEIHGVDVADEMIAQARERLDDIPHAHAHHTNGSDLALFPTDHFDFVYSLFVFQHIPSAEVVFFLPARNRARLETGRIRAAADQRTSQIRAALYDLGRCRHRRR